MTAQRYNLASTTALMAVAAWAAFGTMRAAGDGGAAKLAPNPHWSADGCKECHDATQGEPKSIPPQDIDGLCLKCHDGRRAREEAHPVGRTFGSAQVTRPEGWPAYGGKIGCATCHDILQACHRDRARPLDNPAFLRGFEAGKLLSFCARCHLDLQEQKVYNVHIMLDESNATIRRACQFCHHALLDERDRRVRTGNPELRYEPITLCRSCHMQHVDYFDPGHIGATVSPEMKAYMAAFERTPPGTRPTGTAIERALRGDLEPERLPLQGATVVCSTCHNPHQQGVFPSDSTLAYGAIQTGQERTKMRLRGLGKEFCLACHNK